MLRGSAQLTEGGVVQLTCMGYSASGEVTCGYDLKKMYPFFFLAGGGGLQKAAEAEAGAGAGRGGRTFYRQFCIKINIKNM